MANAAVARRGARRGFTAATAVGQSVRHWPWTQRWNRSCGSGRSGPGPSREFSLREIHCQRNECQRHPSYEGRRESIWNCCSNRRRAARADRSYPFPMPSRLPVRRCSCRSNNRASIAKHRHSCRKAQEDWPETSQWARCAVYPICCRSHRSLPCRFQRHRPRNPTPCLPRIPVPVSHR
jgi:hypothetical protein